MKPPIPYLPPLPNPGIPLKKPRFPKMAIFPQSGKTIMEELVINSGSSTIKSRKKTYHTRKNIQWRGVAPSTPPPINFLVGTAVVVTIAVTISIVKKALTHP
ncbi:hypothetical protein Salat_0630600 [Sesamum alatum]|uniref:Uncharacterized protein n=1 Tax=Sesamum alatum TaxID=300844 RepID=A0AAE1YRJ0_9LAMI|nr:hypothetical protein Salat_0630600 [Sesamum alatum]